MIDITKILVPMDLSEPSIKALAYGVGLAMQFKAKLVVAQIVSESEHPSATLRDILPAERAAAVDLRTISRIGNIDDELLKIVESESIDLVVMGTHGRHHDAMLRKVPTPILTVSDADHKQHELDDGFRSVSHILYAAALPRSSPGMEYAFELAQRTGARLTVVHVIEHLNVMYAVGEHVTGEGKHRVEEMQARFGEFLSRENKQAISIDAVIRDGKAYEEIVRVAKDRGVDMIVQNMHDKGIIERAFLGSTAERVVGSAPVPVLSVPGNYDKQR